jgi:drug/metabolite transporter (DMT)-like permease
MSDNSTSESQRLSLRQLLLADLALLAVAVIWGVNIPVMKVALESGITPYSLNAIRLVVSAIVLLGCAGWEYRTGVRPAAGISRIRIVIYALIVSVAYQYFGRGGDDFRSRRQ